MAVVEEKLLLWCLLCGGKFSLNDVSSGVYFSGTGVCLGCYKSLKKDESKCFGKVDLYDKETQECGIFCPDRKICKAFVELSISRG